MSTIDFNPALSAQAIATAAARPPADIQGAAERFSRMMAKEPDPGIYAQQHLMAQGSPATQFVSAQERVLQNTFDAVRSFTAQAPNMDMHELAARHIELSYQVSMAQMQFNAGVYVSQSGKSGLQTLMKNQ